MRSGFVVALVLAFLAVPAFAQSSDVAVWYSASHVSNTRNGSTSIEFDDGSGYGVSYNKFFGQHLSAELTYDQLRYDGQMSYLGEPLLDIGRMKTKAITAIAQFHLARAGFIDPYIGAGAAYMKADDLSSADLDAAGIGTVSIDKKWGWAANLGVNLNLTHNFAVAVDGKYIPYEPESGGSATKLKLNPTVVSAGLRFRF